MIPSVRDDDPPTPEPMLELAPLPAGSGYALRGILDLSTAHLGQERLERVWRPGATVVLDLSGVEFMDSTGLNLICRGLVAVGERGSLVLRNAQGMVRRVLSVSGIEARPNVRIEDD